MAQTRKATLKAPARRDTERGREVVLAKRLSAAERRIARLEEIIEDRLDAEVAERNEREARERGDEPIPWEVARRDLA